MKKVNLYVDDATWQAFRICCLQHHISASQQFGLLMIQWLHDAKSQQATAAEAEEKRLASGDQSPRLAAG